jgi:hypothetical protein
MFVGHYAPAFALKPAAPGVPLWALFISVQLLDLVWALLILTGVEHARMVPGHMALSPIILDYMPYSHSLPAGLGWAAIAGTVAALVWRRAGAWRSFGVVALAVISHWVLGLIVHGHDLPLWPNGPNAGFGLWDHPALAIPLELGLLSLGFWLYVSATKHKGPIGERAPLIVLLIAIMAYGINLYGTPPATPQALAAMALATYTAFAGLAAWLDHTRTAK